MQTLFGSPFYEVIAKLSVKEIVLGRTTCFTEACDAKDFYSQHHAVTISIRRTRGHSCTAYPAKALASTCSTAVAVNA